jgi:23S rRNA pseudouridine1911/1915/1917 synthase
MLRLARMGASTIEADDEDEELEPAEPPEPLDLTDGHRAAHLRVLAFDGAGRAAVLEHRFTVENECHGWRLDRFLMKRMPRLSRARIQRVIRGDLDVDGVRETRPARTVLTGQRVAFRRPAPAEPEAPRTFSVAHEDASFYALDKPAGLPIHPTARYHYNTLTAVLRERFPGEALQVCHRLDRETSGLLLVARSREAGAALKRAFARRQVEKRYLAIVHGALEGELTIDAPLGLAGGRVRVQMAVKPLAQGGLPSLTRVRALERRGRYTLVEARPETGRQHQIRAHLAHAGHPIVGDKLYPDDAPFIEWADHGMSPALLARLELERHALHAAHLALPHPASGDRVAIDCPLPPDLAALLDGEAAAR